MMKADKWQRRKIPASSSRRLQKDSTASVMRAESKRPLRTVRDANATTARTVSRVTTSGRTSLARELDLEMLSKLEGSDD